MKKSIYFLFWFTLPIAMTSSWGQSGFPKYYAFYALWQKGDSCFVVKDYSKAGKYFEAAAAAEIEQGLDVAREGILYSAACAYALADKPKQALKVLAQLAFERNYRNIEELRTDSSLLSLHTLKKWSPIEAQIAANDRIAKIKEQRFQLRTTPDSATAEVIFYPHEKDYLEKIIHQDSLPFLSVQDEHFRIFFSADSYAAKNLGAIRAQIAHALQNGLQILQAPEYKRGITLVLFNSVEEMKAVTGVKAQGGIAYPAFDGGLFPITAHRRPQFKHEIFHILSLNLWGKSSCRLLIEGGAVFADNECHFENPIYTINAHYLQTNQLFSVDSLVQHFDEIAVQNDVWAYLQSAGIFKYLYENYGLFKMRRLWLEGFAHFETIYGFSIKRLQTDWRTFLQTVTIPKDFDATKLKDGCG